MLDKLISSKRTPLIYRKITMAVKRP